MSEQLSPQTVRATLEDQLVTLVPLLTRLPRRVDSISQSLERGRFSVNVRILADERDRRFVTGIVQQLTMTMLAAACALGGIILVVSDTGPMMLPYLPVYTFVGFTLLLFAFVLAARALVLIFRHSALERLSDD